MYTIKASCPHALSTKSRLMSDIHSTITTTAGCLFYQLVSFAFEVSLRKSVQISLIAVAGSAHKVRLKQCHVRRALLVQSRFPIVPARRLKCWPHSVATLDTDANEQLVPSTPVTNFCIRKIM